MGCSGSKSDDQPLVILCRQRKELIKAASHHRTALAAAHLSYFQSLHDVGEAIRRFVDEEIVAGSSSSSDSHALTLPSDEGKKPKKRSSSPLSTSISHSVFEEDEEKVVEEEEDSHLHLSSGSELESESESEAHIEISTISDQEEKRSTKTDYPTPPGYPYPAGGWGYLHPNQGMYFMKKSAPPSRPYIFHPENNHRMENARWPSDFGYPSPTPAAPSPAPPSPPNVSTWDFLNVFDTYDYTTGSTRGGSGYYYPTPYQASVSSSPDSKEVREREGIPELEEETEHEVTIKQPYRQRPRRTTTLEKVKEHRREHKPHKVPLKPVPMPERDIESSDTVSSFSESDVESEFHHVNDGEEKSSNGYETKSSREFEKKGVSFELEETTTSTDTSSFDVESTKISSLSSLSIHATRDLKEVVKEIKREFEVASSCGKEVALLLEVNKLPYQHKNNSFKVMLSRIMYLIAPSTRSSSNSKPELSIRLTPRILKMAKTYNGQDVNGSLSSTLDKLYVWEKKLYKEIKDEEKFRAMYEEKCKLLKKMDSYGAETSKIEATRASIRKLLTKIDVCIISVGSISSRIHKLRDEELQPQLTQLIYGLIRMWRTMLKCHQKQFQAIMESKVRSLKANKRLLHKENGSDAVLDLEMELREWCISFNEWIKTHKLYVQSLNGWLSKCLYYEPEATEDGIAPFSPSRIGAPPVFIICKDWQEAMCRISGDNVSYAMQGFASSLHELWEEQRVKVETEQRDVESETSKGRSESGVSALDDLRVDLDSMKKKLVEERGKVKGENIKVVNNNSAMFSSSLKGGLVPIFQMLRKFTTEVVKAHEIVRLHHPQTTSS